MESAVVQRRTAVGGPVRDAVPQREDRAHVERAAELEARYALLFVCLHAFYAFLCWECRLYEGNLYGR